MENIKLRKDEDFFHMLYDNHFSELVIFSKTIVLCEEEAYDIVQEVFCSLWDNCENIRIRKSIRAYLYRSVKNRSINRLRQLGIIDLHKEQIREAYLFSMNIDPDENQEQLHKMRKIIESFPEQMKKVFKLRIDKEKKHKEIAEELQISVNTVKTHLRVGFQSIRERLTLVVLLILYFLSCFF